MQARLTWLIPVAGAAVILFHIPCKPLRAQAQQAVALTGVVSSSEEGPMEGVLVRAKRSGGTVTTAVVTDREGRYRFPQARLEPGQYSLRIRAVGYDLESDATASV